MYAIIEDSGTQFKVTSGDTINIDREVPADTKTIKFDRVLLVGGEGKPKIGNPALANATVTAQVLGAIKGPKVDIFKYKRRKGYRRRQGHRQGYLQVRITDITV